MRGCLALFFALLPFTAQAEGVGSPGDSWRLNLNMEILQPGNHPDRVDHKLYRIDFKCRNRAALPVKKIFDLAVLKSVTTSQSILISTDMPATDASAKIKIPEKPLLLMTPYAVNGNNVQDNRKICPQPIVIAGTQSAYLTPFATYSTTHSPGPIVKAAYAIAELIPPLWSIFQPDVIPAAINRKVSGVQQTQDPIKAILSTFDDDESYGKGFTVKTGKYVVRSDYNEITINVSELPSIVMAKPTSLQASFRALLKAAPEQIKPDAVNATCLQIASAIREAGFSEAEDVPYALVTLSSRLGTKPKMLECLGEAYRAPSIKLGSILWNWIPAPLVLTSDYVANLQPTSFSEVKSATYNFVVAMSRISKGDPIRAAEGLSQLKLIASEKITLEDTTPDDMAGGSGEVSAEELSKKFVDKGFRRFGCMAPVGDKNGGGVSSAISSFLAINAGVDAVSANTGDALLVHAIFKGGLVSKLRVFHELPWAKVNADANEGNCNGFKLRDGSTVSQR